MDKFRILVAEDDSAIRESIGIYLRNVGYEVLFAEDGLEAKEIFDKNNINLVIMDLMMPRMDGNKAIAKIREKSFIPIIILSAKSEDYDKIQGLDIGADDYITKPFNPLELLARVKANLRRYYSYKSQNSEGIIEIDSIKLDTFSKIVEVDGNRVGLTMTEFGILEFLMKNPNKVFTSDQIYRQVWNEDAYDSKTVTVHIRRIREKIEINPKKPKYLQVAWGIGYKFVKYDRREDGK